MKPKLSITLLIQSAFEVASHFPLKWKWMVWNGHNCYTNNIPSPKIALAFLLFSIFMSKCGIQWKYSALLRVAVIFQLFLEGPCIAHQDH